jgi:N-acetylglucosamine-6-phosphate deacetylase
MQLCGRRYDTGQPVRLEIARPHGAAGQIVRAAFCRLDETTARWPWIAPGLVDLQVNGYGGHEFSSPGLQVEQVAAIAQAMLAAGVTRFCPTLTTADFATLCHGLRTVAAACEQSPPLARQIAGIHLEGPYISGEDGPRGAHPPAHCRPPDWDEFERLQAAAGGRIKLLTLAPELPGAGPFIARAAAAGVVVAIGHTAADGQQIRAAVAAGARLSTHLGNGCHRTLPRHPNYLWDQLAEDRLQASLIADGHHLPAEVLKTIVRAKMPKRCILVSDLAAQAGLPPGRYRGNLCDVEVLPSGRLVIAGQTQLLAGAAAPLGAGVANAVRLAGTTLAEAIRMAAYQPAALLGVAVGELAPGDPADLVAFDLTNDPPDAANPFRVRAVIADGELVCDCESM